MCHGNGEPKETMKIVSVQGMCDQIILVWFSGCVGCRSFGFV